MELLNHCVGFLAENSVTKNQKNRRVRGVCRASYRLFSSLYCVLSPEYVKLQAMQEKGDIVDTYPWPYRETWFANWEEDKSKTGYSLVSDNAGFVIKYPASYCAWKINEAVGSWPKRPVHLMSCDSKHWHRLLFHNNYRHTVKRPEPGKHYVGIAPSHGEHGECVWFEGFDAGQGIERQDDTGGDIIFSTYRDKRFFVGVAPAEWYIWVEISKNDSK